MQKVCFSQMAELVQRSYVRYSRIAVIATRTSEDGLQWLKTFDGDN